jgi:hypothetical protein
MPQPHTLEPPKETPHLICPKCFQPMRIRTVLSEDGYDEIKFACESCGNSMSTRLPH